MQHKHQNNSQAKLSKLENNKNKSQNVIMDLVDVAWTALSSIQKIKEPLWNGCANMAPMQNAAIA